MNLDDADKRRDPNEPGRTAPNDEPARVPGVVQAHGALIAARRGDLVVTHVSALTSHLLRVSAEHLLARPLAEVLGAAATESVLLAAHEHRAAPANVLHFDHLAAVPLQTVAHVTDTHLVVEFEPAYEDAVDVYRQSHGVLQALQGARTLDELLTRAVREVRRHTGYDRVQVYRFDDEGHGEIVAEASAPPLSSHVGWRFPATDVPQDARRAHVEGGVHLVVDLDAPPSPIFAAAALAEGATLDLTRSVHRAVPPLRPALLRELGVVATLSVGIVRDGRLWGLLVGQHHAPYWLSLHHRAACDLIGRVLSMCVASKLEAEAFRRRLARQAHLDGVVTTLLGEPDVFAALERHGPDLLRLADADGVMARLDGRTLLVGAVPPASEAVKIASSVRSTRPDEVGSEGGALHAPLPSGADDGVTWFRRPDPRALQSTDVTVRSWQPWQEHVQGRARPWSVTDVHFAQEVRRVLTSTLLTHARERLSFLDSFDALTRLPNRRALRRRVDRLALDERTDAALLFLDLDRFKTVNDSLGHDVGDELLLRTAERLGEVIGERAFLARLGGDEFVVLIDRDARQTAPTIATSIVEAFRVPTRVAGRALYSTVSVGVAFSDASSAADLVRDADEAMTVAKRRGGDGFVIFEPRVHEEVVRRMDVEQELHQAVRDGTFVLHYQPIYHVASRRVASLEALVRWPHPRLGLVPPGEFIGLAEETGLIGRLGEWVLREAVRQGAAWHALGLAVSVAVNVSVQQLLSADFVDFVRATLTEHEVQARWLCVEVTESAIMSSEARASLAALSSAGVRVSIDDFGTGYSSLAYLRRLPVQEVKVDRFFVADIDRSREERSFFCALLKLARTAGLSVVAEGVERDAQWRELRDAECDFGQGFGLTRPQDAAAITTFLLGHCGGGESA